MSKLGYEVQGCDIGDKPQPSDITFVCLPEQLINREVLRPYRLSLLVVRSTVVPNTCEMLELELGTHVLHNPEFLREATANLDEFNPRRIIIGECCKEHGDLIEKLYKPLSRPVHRTERAVSELAKLACNGYLATIISYWNEIDFIAQNLGISGTEVGMLASTDQRISCYGSRYHGKFGGKCLPKDTEHLISTAKNLGMNPVLLEAVMKINEEVI
jgi:UDPglucose 6-dehydrogenase